MKCRPTVRLASPYAWTEAFAAPSFNRRSQASMTMRRSDGRTMSRGDVGPSTTRWPRNGTDSGMPVMRPFGFIATTQASGFRSSSAVSATCRAMWLILVLPRVILSSAGIPQSPLRDELVTNVVLTVARR
jgi:hypothetical protein